SAARPPRRLAEKSQWHAAAIVWPDASVGRRTMRLGFIGGVVVVLIAAALIVAYSSVFTVYQTQQALVLRLGNPQAPVTEPGLHFKAPFIDTVIYIDKRILDLEAPAQEVIASDQKRLVVDAFARYRINLPLRFYRRSARSAAPTRSSRSC